MVVHGIDHPSGVFVVECDHGPFDDEQVGAVLHGLNSTAMPSLSEYGQTTTGRKRFFKINGERPSLGSD
jgi:hypothetical protein